MAADTASRCRLALAAFLAASLGAAAPGARAGDDSLVVLELFTSQGCYSCPPAERLLAEKFLGREGVLALEVHVDYWNDLVYGSAGKWEDEFSKREYTERQYLYNAQIKGRAGAYTPQMVIAGAYEAVGTQLGKIERFIRKVRENPAVKRHDVRVSREADGTNVAVLDGPELEGGVFGIVFEKRVVTEVTGGENKGKTLANHNVVKDIAPLRPDSSGNYRIGPIDPSREGCAFIVQDLPQGVIRSAARCVETEG